MKALPMMKYLCVCATFLILVGLACNLPVSASFAESPGDSSVILLNDPGQELRSDKTGVTKEVSQSEDVLFRTSLQIVDADMQFKNETQPTAFFTPTSQYPWDTSTILQGGATARPNGTPYMSAFEPTATPAVIVDSQISLSTQQSAVVVQASPTLQPTVTQPTLVTQATVVKMSSSINSSGLFSALSHWLSRKKWPKPTQVSPTVTPRLPIVATLEPTVVLSPSAQPTGVTLSPTETPVLPNPTQPPATATPLLPTPTRLPLTATPLPPTPTSVPPTATLPASAPASDGFYWSTGFETGNLSELEANSYGGFVNQGNGTYKLMNSPVHSGKYAAALTIDTSQSSPTGAHAAYMFFWKELPGEAYYYSAWYYIPSGTVPAEWWNIWQWKSTYDGNSNNSQRIFSIGARPLNSGLGLYMVQRLPDGSKVNYNAARNIPLDQWFHIEGYYRQAYDATGQVTVWQDGIEVFNITNAQTVLSDLTVDWSVNNYSNQISPSPCTIYVDDIAISSSRIGH